MNETQPVPKRVLPFAATVLEESASWRQARLARLVQERANLDERAVEVARTGLQLCLFALSEEARAAQRRRTQTLGDGISYGIDALEMQRIAATADIFHIIGVRGTGAGDGAACVEITGPLAPTPISVWRCGARTPPDSPVSSRTCRGRARRSLRSR